MKGYTLLRENGVAYDVKGDKKRPGKTWRISEESAKYIARECERRTRSYTDQIDHIRKLYEAVMELFPETDDLDAIVPKLRDWKRRAESAPAEKKPTLPSSVRGG